MKYITLDQAYKTHAKGETASFDDDVADLLVETKKGKLGTAPPQALAAEPTEAELSDAIDRRLAAIVGKMAPQGKRFSNHDIDMTPKTRVYAQCRNYGSMKNFPNTDAGREAAFRLGHWFRGLCALSVPSMSYAKSSLEFCQKNGMAFLADIEGKGSVENINSSSGFLVPIEFDSNLIDLREKYGVFRNYAKVEPMTSDVKTIPRRRAGVTAQWAGEAAVLNNSQKTWDQVQLVAKKLGITTNYSNELGEDAMINVGDDLAYEIAYNFSLKEDQAGFTGTGTSSYGGIIGVSQALLNVDPTPSNVLGLVIGAVGTASSWSGFTLANFNSVVGALPEYADNNVTTKWYVHKAFWGSVMQRLATAAGGNRVDNIVEGVHVKEFLGYEVVISQVMPKTAAATSVVALLGDLRLACSFGERRQTSIKVSDVASVGGVSTFETDQLAIRGTERLDIVVHDVGESSATSMANARDPQIGPVAGPIVGLATAAT